MYCSTQYLASNLASSEYHFQQLFKQTNVTNKQSRHPLQAVLGTLWEKHKGEMEKVKVRWVPCI